MEKRKYLLPFWGIVLGMLSVVFFDSCRGTMGEEPSPMSEEEVRLERAGRIDSSLWYALRYLDRMGWMTDSLRKWEAMQEELSAEAWVLVEDSTGLLISEKNADQRMYMASITKMMTCLLALENGKMGDSIENACLTVFF